MIAVVNGKIVSVFGGKVSNPEMKQTPRVKCLGGQEFILGVNKDNNTAVRVGRGEGVCTK